MESSQNSPPPHIASLSEGQQIGPSHHRFLLRTHLGSSPLGELWSAEDLSVQGSPLVTLECINPQLIANTAALEALKRHITYGKKLNHKHLLRLHGYFAEGDHFTFISSEPLDTTSLASLLKEGKTKKLSENHLKGLLLQIAVALDTAFSSQHLTHGALCPALIRINRGSGVKITGFGLREVLDRLPAEIPHTQRYALYQAPESHQEGGHDRLSDLYSLACISYEVMTGHPPFASTQDANQCDPSRLTKPSQLSDLQWQQLQAALAFDPADRHANCVALIKALFQPDPETPVEADAADEPQNRVEVISEPAQHKTTPHASDKDSGPSRLSALSEKLPSPRLMATFIVGIVLGYLLAQCMAEEPVVTDIAAQSVANDPQTPDTLPTQASESAAPPLDTAVTDTAADETEPQAQTLSLEDLLGEPKAPRTLLFRDQIKGTLYGPDMVALPQGSFKMGDSHKQGDDNEYPVHTVTIQHRFALSRYEVTFAQYDRFAKDTGRPLPDDERWGRGSRPVINVTWHDAQAYTQWLAEQTGQPYRLPTEAEWEYAARAGSTTTFFWGNRPTFGYAVCDECGSDWDGRQSAPVGSLRANAWGLYDMSGNVSEWVADCYKPDYQGAPTDGSARIGDACDSRVMRGGSWFDIMRLMRPAGRYRHPSQAKQNDWGFRVALDLPPSFGEPKE